MLSSSFLVSATVFVIVMTIFHVIKDTIIGHNITPDIRSKINKRWVISTAIGLLVLYLMYGRNGP